MAIVKHIHWQKQTLNTIKDPIVTTPMINGKLLLIDSYNVKKKKAEIDM